VTPLTDQLPAILDTSPVRVVFGPGTIDALGTLARDAGATRVLIVTDPGIASAGHVARVRDSLQSADLVVEVFDGARENPTTQHVEKGLAAARAHWIDFMVGLGGGSAMDCAKGINLLYTNGGAIADYWGQGKTHAKMLPMIAVPTTAGTGSEAQSFALISDPETHVKMACGDRRPPTEGGLRPVAAILDPDLTASQPPRVAVASGIDAIAHAVETAASNRRTDTSRQLSVEAWQRLRGAFPTAIQDSAVADARADMLTGAHLAGAAIEQSMLGAAHACANPLTARFGVVHGLAVGAMLPHVMRCNHTRAGNVYSDLEPDFDTLVAEVERFLRIGRVPIRLRDHGICESDIEPLAQEAARQWTARFNPAPLDVQDMQDLYRAAW